MHRIKMSLGVSLWNLMFDLVTAACWCCGLWMWGAFYKVSFISLLASSCLGWISCTASWRQSMKGCIHTLKNWKLPWTTLSWSWIAGRLATMNWKNSTSPWIFLWPNWITTVRWVAVGRYAAVFLLMCQRSLCGDFGTLYIKGQAMWS